MEHCSAVHLHPESFLLEALLSPLSLFDLKCTFQALTRLRLTSFTICKEWLGLECMITYLPPIRIAASFGLLTFNMAAHCGIQKGTTPLAIYSSSLRVHLALRQQLNICCPKDTMLVLQDLGK